MAIDINDLPATSPHGSALVDVLKKNKIASRDWKSMAHSCHTKLVWVNMIV